MRVAITGATSGIGAASAARLKAEGAQITGFDIAEPQQHVDEWIKVDMSDPGSISQAVAEAQGRFDALLNIAGLPPREGQTARVLQVNFLGLVSFTNAFIDRLNPGASIVNLASRAGAEWRENLAQVKGLMALEDKSREDLESFINSQNIDHVRSYNLSKEAVIVWTMAQTERLIALGLRMNSISPTAVSTGILTDFKNAFGPRVDAAMARAGRAGTAEEIAALAAFLAKPESNWIKGSDITIDGGMGAMFNSDALGLNPLKA